MSVKYVYTEYWLSTNVSEVYTKYWLTTDIGKVCIHLVLVNY